MKKIIAVLSLVIVLLIGGCTSGAKPILKGGYQSDKQKFGYAVVISFQQDDGSFTEYIDNREVDRGTYEKIKDDVYKIKSEKQDFQVTLTAENSFEIIINKINDGKPIELKNISATPMGFLTKFNDVDEYKALLAK